MHIYIGVLLLAAVIILSILLLCGLPLGELTMGGRYKVWPRKLKPIAASQLAARGFMVTNLDGGVIAWQDAGKALVK